MAELITTNTLKLSLEPREGESDPEHRARLAALREELYRHLEHFEPSGKVAANWEWDWDFVEEETVEWPEKPSSSNSNNPETS